MDVEEQHRTVLAADRRQLPSLGDEISIRCLAVGDVDDDRRKSVRMLLAPRLDQLGGVLERGAHRRAPLPIGVEPDWKGGTDRKSTRLNSSHMSISYAVFCLKKKKKKECKVEKG